MSESITLDELNVNILFMSSIAKGHKQQQIKMSNNFEHRNMINYVVTLVQQFIDIY